MKRYTALISLSIIGIAVIAGITIGYAYTATYVEDSSQEAQMEAVYISISKSETTSIPGELAFCFSTKNSEPGVSDVVIDTSQPMTVSDEVAQSELVFEETETGWVAIDDTNKRKFTLSLDSDAEAEAIMLLGSYQINHYGSNLDVTVSASKASGDDPKGVIGLTLSAAADYGGDESPITVSAGDTVYVYAHVDISDVFGTEGYGTVTIPSITLSITAQPEEI